TGIKTLSCTSRCHLLWSFPSPRQAASEPDARRRYDGHNIGSEPAEDFGDFGRDLCPLAVAECFGLKIPPECVQACAIVPNTGIVLVAIDFHPDVVHIVLHLL